MASGPGGRATGAVLLGLASVWLPLVVIDMRRCTRETRLRQRVEGDLRAQRAEQEARDARLQRLRSRVLDVVSAGGPDIALQPVVDLASGRIDTVEALARFRDGRPPAVWFAEAEEAGLGVELELAAARAAIGLLPSLPVGMPMSVNVSPSLLLDRRFVALIESGAESPARLLVEITEHAAVVCYDSLATTVGPLRSAGMRVAVDDTGAGYASLAHVMRLRPDVIKVDRSLVSEIDADAARRAVVAAIVRLAEELGASVVAEGVETSEELDTVACLGVDCVQGYLLARPTTDPVEWRRWTSRRLTAPWRGTRGSARAAGSR